MKRKSIIRRPDGRYTVMASVWPNYKTQWTSAGPVDREVAEEKLHELKKTLKEQRNSDRQRETGSLTYENLKALCQFHFNEKLKANPDKPSKIYAGIPKSIWDQIIAAYGTVSTRLDEINKEYSELSRAYFDRMEYLNSHISPLTGRPYKTATKNMNKQVFASVFSLAVARGKLKFSPVTIAYETPGKRDRVRTAEEKDAMDREMLRTNHPMRFAVWTKEKNKIRPEQIFKLPKTAYISEQDRIVFEHTKTGKRSAYIELPEWFKRYVFMIPMDCPLLFPKLSESSVDGSVMWEAMPEQYDWLWRKILKGSEVKNFHFKDLDHEAHTFMRNKYTREELEQLGQDMEDETDETYFHKEHIKVQRKPDQVRGEIIEFKKAANM
jgi:hypothetical protein